MDTPIISKVIPLGFPWQTEDPFLFCVHHDDAYPVGNPDMSPAASLDGRDLGQDFAGKDGWSMYHGRVIPGFPRHPHRGFETVTVARQGFIDHSDSLGATARFGEGDVQWMTAGQGIVHSEMFPLLETDRPNPTELFQIWLNLPGAKKMVPPHFSMLWSHTIPHHIHRDPDGRATRVTVIAGELADERAPAPPPHSWASFPDAHVAILSVDMEPSARFSLSPGPAGINRTLYFFRGDELQVAGRRFGEKAGIRVRPDAEVTLENGDARSELLILQGRPIGEPVVNQGPFVVNTRAEIRQAYLDFQRTGYGGWPWPSDGPVHPRDRGRFAMHADGRVEHADDHPLTGAGSQCL